MQNYYIRNRETDKLELHFDKATYQKLDREKRAEIKSYFLFSRQAEAWVSKARLVGGMTNAWYPEKIAKSLGLEDAGSTGERRTQLQEVQLKSQKLDRKQAYYTNVDESVYIDWEQYIPSDRLSQDHNSVSFFNHNYPQAFKNEMKETISDIKTRLKVASEQEIPTYVKTAVERYAKAYSEYLARYVRNRTYAPSPMVVGPAKYPWHRLDKAHNRDGKNFADLDEAQKRLKSAVERANPNAFEQRTDPAYLQNRVDEAQAQVKKAERGLKKGGHDAFYERLLTESNEVLAYWQGQLSEIGGLRFSKQSLTSEGATHVKYGGKLYPIVRLSDKTVTIGKWFNDDPKITFPIPYAKIGGSLVRWEDALLLKPGAKKPKVETDKPAVKAGEKALHKTYYGLDIVTVKSVGRKNYQIGGYGPVPFDKIEPLGLHAQDRLNTLAQEAKPYKKEIVHSIDNLDDPSRYDLKHFLNYKTKVYRNQMTLLHLDLKAAGYPERGGLIAFFKETFAPKKADRVKNAQKRSASTSLKKAKVARTKTAQTKKKQAIERIAQRRGVDPATVKVYLDTDTNTVRQKRTKSSVNDDQLKRKAIKSGNVSSTGAKLTKAERQQIKQQGIQDAEKATGKKKTLTAEQVIKIGRMINFNRYHIVIEGKVYTVREDFDTPVTNKRRLAPTEENLLKWAQKPGRYDLIGVDAAGKVDVTVHKKRDKNAVPKRIRYAVKHQALAKATSKSRKPAKRKAKKP